MTDRSGGLRCHSVNVSISIGRHWCSYEANVSTHWVRTPDERLYQSSGFFRHANMISENQIQAKYLPWLALLILVVHEISCPQYMSIPARKLCFIKCSGEQSMTYKQSWTMSKRHTQHCIVHSLAKTLELHALMTALPIISQNRCHATAEANLSSSCELMRAWRLLTGVRLLVL